MTPCACHTPLGQGCCLDRVVLNSPLYRDDWRKEAAEAAQRRSVAYNYEVEIARLKRELAAAQEKVHELEQENERLQTVLDAEH